MIYFIIYISIMVFDINKIMSMQKEIDNKIKKYSYLNIEKMKLIL